MLLYEYPPKLSRRDRQLKAASDLAEHKKMQKGLYKSLVLGAVILVIAVIVKPLLLRVVFALIGGGNIAVALLLYRYSALSRSTECYTRIYDDHLEHRQGSVLTGRYFSCALRYEDIEKSEQTPQGDMTFYFKDGTDTSAVITEPSPRRARELGQGSLTLHFQDTKSKLYLIENLHEQIHYPKKSYNVIEDEEDEDDLWDPLHKHGL
ncbi:MAG: hypothetical protein IJ746_04125 [Ruminococcus sp.]|nr:hypothetical protein [Ruminococcus sp.]